MTNNTYIDTANDSWCNRVKDKINALQKRAHLTDFTCPFQVRLYNDAVQAIKYTVPMISEIELEEK